MKTKRGDVVLVLFPNSDLHTAKRRPALVIQRDELSGGLAQTIVAMTDNLATVFETEMNSILGHLPDIKTVDAALKHTLALD